MTSSTQHAQNPDYNYCALPLASYACRPDESKGRLYEAPENGDRTVFQREPKIFGPTYLIIFWLSQCCKDCFPF